MVDDSKFRYIDGEDRGHMNKGWRLESALLGGGRQNASSAWVVVLWFLQKH